MTTRPTPLGAAWRTLHDLKRRVHTVLLAIVGAPNYERYVAHVASRHGCATPMSRDEFARDRLAARYDRPGSRCC